MVNPNSVSRLPARPRPPAGIQKFQPAQGVGEWVNEQILAADGAINNPDHSHLLDADIEFMWAPGGFSKQMRTVIGTAEEVTFRSGGWQKMRQEEQFISWFQRIPSFLITLDAYYCEQCTDADWCALVEHELYHLAQKMDRFGAPVFTRDGAPKIAIRGHDVEEFVGVVRRYGVGDPNGAIAQLARASGKRPEVNLANIAGACGTCILRAA